MAASTNPARRHLRDGLKNPLRVALALPFGSGNGHTFSRFTSPRNTQTSHHRGPTIAAACRSHGSARVEDYVRAHLAKSISIETLAELAELSPFHFSRVFKQATGITPLQFVTRERRLQAQQLIRETSAASSKSRSKSAILVRAILLRYFGGRWAWLQRSSATPSKSKRAHRFSARIRQAPHDPESSYLVDGRCSRRASMVQPRKKTTRICQEA